MSDADRTGRDEAEMRAHAEGLKVHLRVVTLGQRTYRVVTLRPATRALFSTNFFHGTWHILTDREGAFVLARLLWGLAFQREPGTLVLLDGTHLARTPFEADPADPVLLLPAGRTPFDPASLRLLKLRLRHPASGTTIRWHTFGLPHARAETFELNTWRGRYREEEDQRSRERMQKVAGFVCYSAPPDILRSQALSIYAMRTCKEVTHHYLAEGNQSRRDWRIDGEVQVFPDFRDRVSSAAVARHSVLGPRTEIVEGPEGGERRERERIHRRAARVGNRLKAARQKRDRP